ncbi:MAG: hypothetical protein IKT52_10560 [Oscillospiraceae bacterium]|nr:hypothetical protein [Oscillospiraceae bacterium]
MKCPKCQAEVAAGHKFCMSCGAPVPALMNSTEHLEEKLSPKSVKENKKRRTPKKIVLIALACVLVAIVAIAFGDLDSYFQDPINLDNNPVGGESASDQMTDSTTPAEEAATQTEWVESGDKPDTYYSRAYEVAVSEYSKYLELMECSDFMQEAYANEITLDMLNRQPEYYEDMEVYFGGTVLQAIYDSDNPSNVELRIRDINSESEQNVVYVRYTLKSGELRILEGDYVDMYGLAKGLISYESVRGDQITIPLIDAKYLYAYAEVEGSLDTPAMKTFKSRVYGYFVSEDGANFSFEEQEDITDSAVSSWSDATEYGDCIVAYYSPEMGWDPDNPPPFYRVVAFSDGTMVIFEPSEHAIEGIYALDDGTYTKYIPVRESNVPQVTGGKAAQEMYIGDWGDEVSQRASMSVAFEDDIFVFVITWANSASTTAEWILYGEYDYESGYVNYSDGIYTMWEMEDEYSDPVENVQYTDGYGRFRIEDGYMYWDDFRNHAGATCQFVKID